MARIRSVKPELRRDLTVADWPRDCRYAWVLLWGYLDDHGRGLDDLRLLVADLFPLDRDVTERKLDGWLKRMTAASPHGEPPLCRYQIDGRNYLHAPKWSRSQRVSHPQESKVPPCPVHECDRSRGGTPPEPHANGSGADQEAFATSRTPEVLGVKGARGQGVKGAGTAAPASPSSSLQVVRAGPPTPDVGPAQIVAAYVDAVTGLGGVLDQRAKGRIAKDAVGLLNDGAPPGLLVAAAQRLAANGYADLGAEARRAQAARPGARPSASDAAAQAAIEAGQRVAARHAAQEGA